MNDEPLRDLGEGLIMRSGRPEDIVAIADLMGKVFRDREDEPFNAYEAEWATDLGSGRHPFTDVHRCLVVEDRMANGAIVASLWPIPVVWSYGDIPFAVGRPEEVGTAPPYRNRGLIRAMMEEFHRRSTADGELVQAITGIPYFYRQFGYEFAVDLGWRGRSVSFADIPPRADEPEMFRLRFAEDADLPFVMALYDRDRRRDLVSAVIPPVYWRWALDRTARDAGQGWHVMVIEDAAGQPAGYALPRSRRGGDGLGIAGLGVREGVSLVAVRAALLRALRDLAERTPPARGDEPARYLRFQLGREHPLYAVLDERFAPRHDRPYAWYVRVPDVARFLRHVAPTLEARVAGSALDGYSGDVLLSFYREGVRLAWEHGRLMAVESWRRGVWGPDPQARFPPLVFLSLLFGRYSLDDLMEHYPDVGAAADAAALLRVIFPAAPSNLLELD